MSKDERINAIIEKGLFRRSVYDLIPEKSRRIFDIGYGDGALLMRLKRDKGCEELYGLEINERSHANLEGLLDGNFQNFFPDQPLDDKYKGFFSHIVMHDVVEHLYNPYDFLMHVRRYLAEDGRIIMVTPNLQYWDIVHAILQGDFPYGCGGLMNEDHVRWFTMKSLVETAILGGLAVEKAIWSLPQAVRRENIDLINSARELKVLQMPPDGQSVGNRINPFPAMAWMMNFDQVDVRFARDIRPHLIQFLAVKLILVCKANPAHTGFQRPFGVGTLKPWRKEFQDKHGATIHELLPRDVGAVIE